MHSQNFNLANAIAILERTPITLSSMLAGLSDVLIQATEGEGTWSPYDVIGHLIHGELTDWIPRAKHILAGETGPFETFDRTAQFSASNGKSLAQLLEEFAQLRKQNLQTLASFNLAEDDFLRSGLHPRLGKVNLGQLLATWVVHDLDHIVQVARVIAKHHTTDVGPWTEYLSVLSDRT